MTELGILDLWRDFYPSGHDYTFYSHPHDAYSRIDYFFILKRDCHRIRDCDIGCIDLSDHAPLSCTVDIIDNPGRTLWRLNTSILNNPRFREGLWLGKLAFPIQSFRKIWLGLHFWNPYGIYQTISSDKNKFIPFWHHNTGTGLETGMSNFTLVICTLYGAPSLVDKTDSEY